MCCYDLPVLSIGQELMIITECRLWLANHQEGGVPVLRGMEAGEHYVEH